MAIIIMPKLLSSSFTTTTAVALFLMVALVHSQDVTTFGFGGFVPNPDKLIYQGGAHVPQGSSFARLTQTDSSGNPMTWNTGRVIYSRPVKFWEASPATRQATFETTINFRITPSKNGAADGLVFFIAPPNAVFDASSSGHNFGIFNGSANGTATSVFAAEFDTFINSGWDPSYRHIGIDIESRATARFESATGEVVNARINYNPNTKTISVVATNSYQRAAVSYNFDLKTILPESVEVGISSSTGQTVSYLGVHDIISWYFTSSLVLDTVNDDTYIRQINY